MISLTAETKAFSSLSVVCLERLTLSVCSIFISLRCIEVRTCLLLPLAHAEPLLTQIPYLDERC